MNEEIRSILNLLAQGKITVEEAHQLMEAVKARYNKKSPESSASTSERPKASTNDSPVQFLRIKVRKASNECRPEKEVNIRVPVSLMMSGMRLGSIVEGFGGERVRQKLRERGIDLSHLDATRLSSLLKKGEMLVDVDDGKSHIEIICE